MSKYTEITTLADLKQFVLYGETNKVPYSLLGDDFTPSHVKDFNGEQLTKLDIAATLIWLMEQGYELTKS